MRRDMVISFIIQFFVFGLNFLLYKVVTLLMGAQAFSLFSFLKRVSAFLQSFLLMGMGVSVVRFVAMYRNSSYMASLYAILALVVVVTVFTILSIIVYLFPETLAKLLPKEVIIYYKVVSFFAFSICFHVIVYSYLRGKLLFTYANALQFVNIGLIPLISTTVAAEVADIFIYSAIGVTSISFFAFIFFIWDKFSFSIKEMVAHLPSFLGYGFQRMLGEFALSALFTLPSFYALRKFDIELAGIIAFAFSLLRMVGSIVAPIGVVLLPYTVTLLEDKESMSRILKKTLLFSIIISFLIFILSELAVSIIVRYFVPTHIEQSIHIMKIIFIGVFGYVIYVFLRSIVDAISYRAWNTFSIFVSLTIMLIGYLVVDDFLVFLYITVLSMLTLGVLTFSFIFYRLRVG